MRVSLLAIIINVTLLQTHAFGMTTTERQQIPSLFRTHLGIGITVAMPIITGLFSIKQYQKQFNQHAQLFAYLTDIQTIMQESGIITDKKKDEISRLLAKLITHKDAAVSNSATTINRIINAYDPATHQKNNATALENAIAQLRTALLARYEQRYKVATRNALIAAGGTVAGLAAFDKFMLNPVRKFLGYRFIYTLMQRFYPSKMDQFHKLTRLLARFGLLQTVQEPFHYADPGIGI